MEKELVCVPAGVSERGITLCQEKSTKESCACSEVKGGCTVVGALPFCVKHKVVFVWRDRSDDEK